MSDSRESPRITELRQAFHNWKHENEITKLFFSYLRSCGDRCVEQIVNNAFTDIPNDSKLMVYHLCAAKQQLINEIISLNLDDEDFQDSILKSK